MSTDDRRWRHDAVPAAVLLVAGLVQALAVPFAPRLVGVAFVLGTTVPVAWRRTRPVEAALVSSAFWVIPTDGFPVLGFVGIVLVFYALGAWPGPRPVTAAVTAWAVVLGVIGTLLGPEEPVAAVGAVLVVVAPVLAGQVVARERTRTAALARLTQELDAERAHAEEAAVTAERARIAQELHDVVGHELTLISIQAEAASMALRSAPERAVQPVETIRECAHRTLREIRETLGVLVPVDAARPSGDGLAEIARRAEASGIANTLETAGAPWPGPAGVWLAVNRVVTECLTNAGRHAPGSTTEISVDWRPDAVTVRASNPTGARRIVPGRGLTGMRHRAELLGGALGWELAEGRFLVEMTLPAEPARVAR